MGGKVRRFICINPIGFREEEIWIRIDSIVAVYSRLSAYSKYSKSNIIEYDYLVMLERDLEYTYYPDEDSSERIMEKRPICISQENFIEIKRALSLIS